MYITKELPPYPQKYPGVAGLSSHKGNSKLSKDITGMALEKQWPSNA